MIMMLIIVLILISLHAGFSFIINWIFRKSSIKYVDDGFASYTDDAIMTYYFYARSGRGGGSA